MHRPHPGKEARKYQVEEARELLGISQYRLAKEIGVPPQRIGEIVAGRRAIMGQNAMAERAAASRRRQRGDA